MSRQKTWEIIQPVWWKKYTRLCLTRQAIHPDGHYRCDFPGAPVFKSLLRTQQDPVTSDSGSIRYLATSLRRRHNGRDGVSNHQPHDCLLNRLIRRRAKKTSKLHVTWPLCGELTGDRWILHTKKGTVTRKIFPFADVIIWFATYSGSRWSYLTKGLAIYVD